MEEKAKRLAPTSDVIRQLYLRSGNQCAFPNCTNKIIDENGNFIGQICHIEAAEEGGERFNPNMTNEERRSYDNLMLMCYEHHIVTNDVQKYTVSTLKQMKRDHEAKISQLMQEGQNLVQDYAISENYLEAKTCKTLSEVLEYGCTDDENSLHVRALNGFLKRLVDLPQETRHVLAIMISRSFQDIMDKCYVPLKEIELSINRDEAFIYQNIDILNRRNIISLPGFDDYGQPFCILYPDYETGWSFCNDIREFCMRAPIPIVSILVDLNFSLFD